LIVVPPFLIFSVHAAEPTLTDIFNTLGFTNVNETTVETFPACTYNITLYAEFAGYSDQNELSYYNVSTSDFNLIFTGPEGGSGYVSPPVNKSFMADYEFGLSMLSPDGQGGTHRYYTETSRNGDGLKHFNVCRNLDDPSMFLIGFENQYGGGDKDYNDMVFSLKPVEHNLTITTTTGGSTDPAPGTYSYSCGSNVSITAFPDSCYQFDHWELDGSNVGSANPYTVTMKSNHTLQAVFVIINYTLTITTTTGGTTNPAPGSYVYSCCTNVSVTSIPDTCYAFDHWELDSMPVGSANPYVVHMDANHTLNGVFVQKTFWLTIQVDGTGTTNPSPGAYQYPCSQNVSVTAIEADPCWKFDHWELDGSNVGSTNPYTVDMDGNHTLTAVFVQEPFSLTIQVDGTGTTIPSPGVYQHSCCTNVSVTAVETDPCWKFDHWELDSMPVGSANPYTVHIDADHTLHAVFTEVIYTLTITTTAGGTTNPSLGDHDYPCGTEVQVAANSYSGYVFDHWVLDGSDAGSSSLIYVTMNEDHTLHAVFEEAPSPPPSVGGSAIPITIDLGTSNSLIPLIGLVSTFSAVVAATIMLVRCRKKTLKRKH
jgi:hypothetical protein